jgi:hypothetical protein
LFLFRISNRPNPAIDVSMRPYSPAYIGGSSILASARFGFCAPFRSEEN